MASVCSTLPEHLHEKILTFLPTIDLLRLRAVCKQWLQVISSSPLLLRSRAPWLLLHSQSTHSFACDLEAKEWYKLPPCVLPRRHVLHGCVQGLLVAESRGSTGSLGDPWTGSWIPLTAGFHFDEETNSHNFHACTCRLCGFHFDEETNSHTILASSWYRFNSSFREVTHVFRSLDPPSSSQSTTLTCSPQEFMVECKGALYSRISPGGLIIYHQGKDKCLYEDGYAWITEFNCTLLNCGDVLVKVFVATLRGGISWRYNKEALVIIHRWQEDGPFQESLQWEEVEIMPPTLLVELLHGHSTTDIEFSSAGACKVCFRALMGIKILTFDIMTRIWEWLPMCPDLPTHIPNIEYQSLRGFGLQVWPRFFSQMRTQHLEHQDNINNM